MGKIIRLGVYQEYRSSQRGGNVVTTNTNTMNNIDFINVQGKVQGDVANAMADVGLSTNALRPFFDEKRGKVYVSHFKGGDPKDIKNYQTELVNDTPNRMVANATLRRDEWKSLDQAVLKIAETRLKGIKDLEENGLTFSIGNGMGSTVLQYESMSDAMQAELTMDGITRSLGDRPVFETHYLPLPIIHSDFEINARALAASRTTGQALDTLSTERAARKVMALLEDMLFQDTQYSFGGGTIYSYLNHPDRNLVQLSTYGAWDDESATTALDILECVKAMKQASVDKYHFGPWMLYVPLNYTSRLDNDYDSTTPGTTIRERLMKVDGIKGIKIIDNLRTSDESVEADNVLLVEMSTETVRLVKGMGISTVQWNEEGKMVTKYKVMSIQVPQIRSDQEGRSGVVHAA